MREKISKFILFQFMVKKTKVIQVNIAIYNL